MPQKAELTPLTPAPESDERLAEAQRTESRQRWIVAATIALLVLLPVVGARILETGSGPDPGHASDRSETVDTERAARERADEEGLADEPAATMPAAASTAGGGPWRFATTDEVWSQPTFFQDAALGGLILVGSDDGTVHGLDAGSGLPRWSHEGSGAVRSRVQISNSGDDALAVWSSSDGTVRAADLATGELRWTSRAGARSGVASDRGDGGGRVVAGTESGLVALDAATGRTVWRADVGSVGARPALAQGRVYAGTAGGRVVAVEVRSGRQRWAFEAGAAVGTSPDHGDGHVLVTAGDGTLFCLGADDGKERWRSQTSEFVGSAPATAGGRVFVGGGDGALWAYDIRRGLALWRRGLPQQVRGTPTVFHDDGLGDTLWVAAGERYLASVRARDGAPLRVFAVEGWVSASPIPADGRLVFATSEGNVHGLPLSTVDEMAPARPPAAAEPKLVLEPSFHDAEPEVLWRDAAPVRLAAAPAVAGGRVVYGAGRELRALSAASGERLWTMKADGPFDSPPAVVGGRVLAGRRAGADGRGALHAVDLDTGDELWRIDADGDVAATPTVWGPQVIFGGHGGEVISAGLARGTDVWRHRLDGPVVAAAAVSGSRSFGVLVVGDCAGVVTGLAADTGRELWSLDVGDCVATDVLVASAGGQELAFVADAGGTLRAIDPAVGGVLWQADLGGTPGRAGAFAVGSLYLGALDRKVWALSPLDGATLWQFPIRHRVAGAVAVDLGITYAPSLGAGLHALSAINGQEFWHFDVAAPAYDLSVDDGVVYLAAAAADGEGGVLWAFRVP